MEIYTKQLLLTNILHSETVIVIEIGDVVLRAQLHAVGFPDRCVVCIKEALSVCVVILWALSPFTDGSPEGGKESRKKEKNE